jgi:hypothetical protein
MVPVSDEIGDLSPTERENRAVEDFGRWWTSTKTRILLAFILPAAVAGLFGYWLVREIQFRLMGVAVIYVSAVVGFLGPVAAAAWLAKVLGKRIVVARTPGKLDELARTYNIPREQLEHTVALLREL